MKFLCRLLEFIHEKRAFFWGEEEKNYKCARDVNRVIERENFTQIGLIGATR